MSNIKISELNQIPFISSKDFFPMDQSSSLTTYRGSVEQLQSFLSTGSFTGSFTGSLLGTASWADSASIATTASHIVSSSYALSSSRADTASYALNVSSLNGSGTTNYLPIWSNPTSLATSTIYDNSLGSYVFDSKNLIISKSQGFVFISSTINSNLQLANSYTSSDSWVFSVAGDDYPSVSDLRGQLEIFTFTQSNALSSKQGTTTDPGGITRVMRNLSNGLYFWPFGQVQSISRDGTLNIGLDSYYSNTSSRLAISVFSGSSASNPQTYHLHKAIEVFYGSSSYSTTFCVSSSGKTYIGNGLQVVGNATLNSPRYVQITNPGDIVSIDGEKTASQFIQLLADGTASVTMSAAQTVRLIINQANGGNHNIQITGSIYSGSTYYGCPIVWQGGSDPDFSITNVDKADMVTLTSFVTSNLGPKGNGAPYYTVIYATTASNFY